MQDISNLKQLVNCRGCPQDRHCCLNISHEFSIKFEGHAAHSIFGREKVKELINQKKLIKADQFRFKLVDKCPLLTDKNKCSIHSIKEELELNCSEFPVYYSHIGNKTHLVVDYRCYFIEQNWSSLEPLLSRLQDILIVFRSNGVIKAPLKEFLDVQKSLPRQKL